MKWVAIIDYGSGNLRSCAKAFERVAPAEFHIEVTSDAMQLAQASHIVLPGVGAFGDCMEGLRKMPGMLDALEEEVIKKRKPFLGICVGMQMLFKTGYEHGVHQGLGWIDGEVVKISGQWPVSSDQKNKSQVTDHRPLKIPHMGWNDLNIKSEHPLLAGIRRGAHVYFVHSYHAVCDNPGDVVATAEYGTALTAAVAKNNIMGTQFHPEKSQETGLRIIGNFLQFVH